MLLVASKLVRGVGPLKETYLANSAPSAIAVCGVGVGGISGRGITSVDTACNALATCAVSAVVGALVVFFAQYPQVPIASNTTTINHLPLIVFMLKLQIAFQRIQVPVLTVAGELSGGSRSCTDNSPPAVASADAAGDRFPC